MTKIPSAQRNVEVKINVIHPGAVVPEYGTELSAGFDLALCEDILVGRNQTILARTGLVIQAPENHFILVAPRSSTHKNWGVSLSNTVGIVDQDYCGPEDEMRLLIHRPAEAWGDSQLLIPAKTRLAQGIFIPFAHANFVVQDGPIAQNRGGWGSTGKSYPSKDNVEYGDFV